MGQCRRRFGKKGLSLSHASPTTSAHSSPSQSAGVGAARLPRQEFCCFLTFLVLYAFVVVSAAYIAYPACASTLPCSSQSAQYDYYSSLALTIFGALLCLCAREFLGLLAVLQRERLLSLAVSGLQEPIDLRISFCIVIAVLCFHQLFVVSGTSMASALAGQPIPESGVDWMPIDVTRYAEWLISVPLIQIMIATLFMDVPLRKTHWINIVSMLYITAALWALLTTSFILRWMMIVVAFVGYFWVSARMVQMIKPSADKLSDRKVGNRFHVWLTWGWVHLNGFYGVVYLLRILGGIYDGNAYMLSDFTAKASLAFFVAQVRQQEHALNNAALVLSHASLNISYLSLLRSSYDFVLLCSVDQCGACRILPSRDAQRLGKQIGHDIQGQIMNDLISTGSESATFTEYIAANMSSRLPALTTSTPEMARACNIGFRKDDGEALPASVFLSCPLVCHMNQGESQQIVLAVRTDTNLEPPDCPDSISPWQSEGDAFTRPRSAKSEALSLSEMTLKAKMILDSTVDSRTAQRAAQMGSDILTLTAAFRVDALDKLPSFHGSWLDDDSQESVETMSSTFSRAAIGG